MAKYEEPFDDTKQIFDEQINLTDLNQVGIGVKVLRCDSLKEIGQVKKSTDLLKYFTTDDVIILINDLVFEELSDRQKRIIADELLAYVAYNLETGAVKIDKPNVKLHSGILKKYGNEDVIDTLQLIEDVFALQADAAAGIVEGVIA